MNVKILIMDVDGTLTDGKIYVGQNGELFKAFNIKDGYGIRNMLSNVFVDWSDFNNHHEEKLKGIIPVIITARESEIVRYRCKELGITYLYQNCNDKRKQIDELACYFMINKSIAGKYDEIAYIGDDIIDLQAMKVCGLAGAPSDAVKEIKQVADYVANVRGGDGAVREFIEFICAQVDE